MSPKIVFFEVIIWPFYLTRIGKLEGSITICIWILWVKIFLKLIINFRNPIGQSKFIIDSNNYDFQLEIFIFLFWEKNLPDIIFSRKLSILFSLPLQSHCQSRRLNHQRSRCLRRPRSTFRSLWIKKRIFIKKILWKINNFMKKTF